MALTAKFALQTYRDKNDVEQKAKMMLKFLDSYQFMSKSLDSLVRNLDYKDLKYCQSLNLPDSSLVTAKGVFPYSYLDSMERLQETELPPRGRFGVP